MVRTDGSGRRETWMESCSAAALRGWALLPGRLAENRQRGAEGKQGPGVGGLGVYPKEAARRTVGEVGESKATVAQGKG